MRKVFLIALLNLAAFAVVHAQSGYYGNPGYNTTYNQGTRSYDQSYRGGYTPAGQSAVYGSRYSNPYSSQPRSYGLTSQGDSGSRTRNAMELGPEIILRAGIERLKGFMAGGGGQGRDADRFIDNEIAPFFDFDYMAKWAAGPRWRYLSAEQRNQMSTTIKRLFLAALAKNISGYGDPIVRIHRARAGRSRGEVSVSATVSPRYGRGVRVVLKFRFYKSPDGWKIFDVSANNTSAVLYYRRYFNRMAAR